MQGLLFKVDESAPPVAPVLCWETVARANLAVLYPPWVQGPTPLRPRGPPMAPSPGETGVGAFYGLPHLLLDNRTECPSLSVSPEPSAPARTPPCPLCATLVPAFIVALPG